MSHAKPNIENLYFTIQMVAMMMMMMMMMIIIIII